MAFAMHKPTVMVKAGLIEEARTISILSPVARMESPSRVPRNRISRMPVRSVAAAASTASFHEPPMPVSSKRVNMASDFRRLALALQPMTMRFMV